MQFALINMKTPKKLNNPANWTIGGMSVAGVATSMYLVEPSIMVDAGALLTSRCKPVIPSHLLITHHHSDHNRHIGYYASRRVNIIDPITNPNTKPVTNPVTNPNNSLGGRVYEMSNGIVARTIKLNHTVKSVGYGIESLDGTKEVVMMGDTRIDPLYEIPTILDYPVIVIECTNYDSDPQKIDMYNRYGHISWKEIKMIIDKNRDNYFHLIHPSSKLSKRQKYLIQKELITDNGIRNASIWLN